MSLHVYLVCHNEEVLLPHTVEHYRRRVPGVTFTILDNESDDRSVAIARELGCAVQTFSTGGTLDDAVLRDLKNTVWLERTEGWVIVVDMDEWLCVTAEDLEREEQAGTTVLRTNGWNVLGESALVTLADIDLHELKSGQPHPPESKAVCFRRPQIQAMNYSYGAHRSSPRGTVRRSRKTYRLKHMAWLGAAFIVHKYARRYERGAEQRTRGLGIHYSDNAQTVLTEFNTFRARARTFSEKPFWALPTLPSPLLPFIRRRAARVVRRILGIIDPSRRMSS
jgi:hypothetical protein